ncbi:MAG: GPO family capsid scaffolding protein [Parashewanella sp.]
MSQLTTEWIRVATEGETFQNVQMQRQWLVDIAETYNTNTYSARIWPDHRRWYGAWGDVLEVKTEEQDGKLRLFVKLKPNSQLIQANEQDQKVFCSIEVDPNFAGTGKAYLYGIGVTDEPASLGAEKLKFSTSDERQRHAFGNPEQMVMNCPTDDNDSEDDENGLIKAFTSFVKHFSKTTTPNNPETKNPAEEEPMDKEQFNSLMAKIGGIETKVNGLETKVENFSKELKADPEPKTDPEPTPEPKDESVSPEQFSKLETAITGLVSKVDGMEKQFSVLSSETPNQEPDPVGDENFTLA